MKLLIVEDDWEICELLQEVLTARQYVVDVANDGQTGWDYVEMSDYDLILLDVMLPKLDGFGFCRRGRKSAFAFATSIALTKCPC